MELIDFLKKINSDENLNSKILIFRAEVYSALFFSKIINILNLKKTNFTSISIDHIDKSETVSYFNISFLGESKFYWLKDIFEDLSVKLTSKNEDISKFWKDFLHTYEGPHSFGFYMPKTQEFVSVNPTLIIDIPNLININLFKDLYFLLYQTNTIDNSFLSELFRIKKTFTLDESLKTMSYMILLGKKHESFFSNWIDKILLQDKSLFSLSQYLFAQEKTEFFKNYLKIKDDYAAEFWVSYWSSQLTQAIIFITLCNLRGIVEAKKSTNRLPFSFINKDYKKYNSNFLIQAHNYLYEIDFALKNGIDQYCLDLWYHKFLNLSF